MIFGPFDISNESLTSVEFVESYVYGEATLDSNLVEISIDGGDNWETVFVSDPSILDSWAARLIDISNYEGQTILLSFRYIDSNGNAEGWKIDQLVVKETIEAERSFSQHNEPLDLDYSIQELSIQSYGPDEIQNFYEKLVVKS